MSSTTDPGDNSGDKPASDNFNTLDTLLINSPVDTLNSSDSLVEPSLSDTILLQNVHFDSNLFDGVNLELNNNTNDSPDFNLATESGHSISLLDNLELQILKEVQSSSQSNSHKFLNSSDPLVSSTTTLFSFEDSQNDSQVDEDQDNLEFKYFDETCDSLVCEPSTGAQVAFSSGNTSKSNATVASMITTDKAAVETVSATSVMLEAIPSTLDIKSAITLPDGTFVNEKLFLTTTNGPIATLSLANMKVLGPNMVASVIISGGECEDGKKDNPLLPSTAQVQIISKQPEVKAKQIAASKECKPNRSKDETVKSANKATPSKEVKGSNSTASSSGSSGDSSQFTDADSNSGNPSSKAFVPCKVCGDKASGYHYGVTSCEGCKGFFRRSIQKQIEYRCLRDGKCLIIRLNRNRCQYCRFKKCLAVGMSRDSVRYGRVPKKSKEKEHLEEKSRVTQAEADQSSNTDVDSKDLALYDTILTISQAHHANCSYTDDKIKGLSKKPIFILNSQIKSEVSECSSPDIGSVSESLEAQKIELWEHLALLITPCIQRVVEFAKRIPGFSDLTQDDQLILIKLGFFEVWLVHISKTADFVENTLTFADGSFLSRKQLELMFDHEFVGNLFHLMSGLTSLNLNDTEIGLFSAIILLQPDRPQIYDVKAINKNQEIIVEALKVQINRNHNSDFQTFQKLMMKINELRALGSSHSLHLQWFRSNWSRLKLPPLLAEIFDIPKSSAAFASQTNSSISPVAMHSTVNKAQVMLPSESAIQGNQTDECGVN